MEGYEVTLWRYPSESRVANKIGESVFYFTIFANSPEDAVRRVKSKFEHAVYDSDIRKL